MVEVVLPTPPFWLTMAITRAGPWEDSGAGSGNSRWGRPVGPITASSRSSSVPSRVAEPCSLLTYLSTLSMTVIFLPDPAGSALPAEAGAARRGSLFLPRLQPPTRYSTDLDNRRPARLTLW